MEKLILGFDLCDDVTKISRYRLDNMNPADISFPQADNRTVIQTALGRKKGQDGWLVGKEAYEAVLEGGGAVVDKLLTLLTKKSSVAVGDRRYQPEQLLGSYIGTLLETVYEQCGTRSVARLVFTLEKTDPGSDGQHYPLYGQPWHTKRKCQHHQSHRSLFVFCAAPAKGEF